MSTIPSQLRYLREARQLELTYENGQAFLLSAEFLRVHSPSAEVRGHGEGQAVLQVGKAQVEVRKIDPVGNYGVKIAFSDGHQTGIYSWEYLRELAEQRDSLWSIYLAELARQGKSRT